MKGRGKDVGRIVLSHRKCPHPHKEVTVMVDVTFWADPANGARPASTVDAAEAKALKPGGVDRSQLP